jgi:hypothetical protein
MILYVSIMYDLIKIGLNLYGIRFEDELFVNKFESHWEWNNTIITVYDGDGNVSMFLRSQLDPRKLNRPTSHIFFPDHYIEYDSLEHFVRTMKIMYPDLTKNAHFTCCTIDNPYETFHENQPYNNAYKLPLCSGLLMATSLIAGSLKYFIFS